MKAMIESGDFLEQLSTTTALDLCSPPPRLVIVHQGALGDLMLALPALDGLAQIIPKVRMDFWGRPELLALLSTKPYLGRVLSCDGSALAPFLLDDSGNQTPIPAFLRDAAGLLIFGQQGSRVMAERLRQRLSYPVVWICSFPDPTQRIAVGEFLVNQVRAAGWPIDPGLPMLEPPSEEIRLITNWFENQGWKPNDAPVLIHPGSGGRSKIWPVQRWWRLLQWLLTELGVPVLLVLGPADEAVRALATAAEKAGVNLIADVSLPRLAALISRCRLFVGNDSGVTHLAAAVQVPTIAVFGPTSPDVWGPRGKNVQIIQSHWEDSQAFVFNPDAAAPGLEEPVQSAIERILCRRSLP
jgi:heptosyltransferase III